VTSIGEAARSARPLNAVRTALLVLFLAFGALATPWPWSLLWIAVPLAVAGSLLLTWRFGARGFLLPAALAVGAVALYFVGAPGFGPWFTIWVPLAAVCGGWMGLREEGGGPSLGARAWMMTPLLFAAVALPLLPGFSAAIERLDTRVHAEQERMMAQLKPDEIPAALREMLQEAAKVPAADRRSRMLLVVPNTLFVWAVALTIAGRALAARIATMLRWPPLSRPPLVTWRLPDAALAPLIAAIAVLLFADRAWQPSALTLLVHVVLGYSVQGVAVVESMLLARGVSPVLVALTMLFVIAVSLLWALPAVAVVGLSDVWLDYRRLEPSEGEA
jgi:hypothetical protein